VSELTLPREPGGVKPVTVWSSLFGRRPAPIVCTQCDCGGPLYCLHRYMHDKTTAVREWILYDLPHPLTVDDLRDLGEIVGTCLLAHVSLRDVTRIGGSVEALAVCGVTLETLLECGYTFETIVRDLNVGWDDLLRLGFDARLLSDVYPVVIAIRAGVTGARLLQTDVTLKHLLRLTLFELIALDLTVTDLVPLGLTANDVLKLIQESGLDRPRACAALNLTAPVFSTLTVVPSLFESHHVVYQELLEELQCALPQA